jgi:hypothetical protein
VGDEPGGVQPVGGGHAHQVGGWEMSTKRPSPVVMGEVAESRGLPGAVASAPCMPRLAACLRTRRSTLPGIGTLRGPKPDTSRRPVNPWNPRLGRALI